MLTYSTNTPVSLEQFRHVLESSGLSKRRPMDDTKALQQMIDGASMIVTCWDDAKLVGMARSLTDYAYACYLADLVVDEAYQHQGIGKRLIDLTEEQLGPHGKIILIAAPAAEGYYGKVGFDHHPQAWVRRKRKHPAP